ncbi:MAG: insulinase family protein [Acidimicrobiia bacterium]|nr:insulinase family protein [Acidimicrobiia bacterium]
MTDGIRRTELDSGVRVVTEALPALRSVAVGFWVGTGSRDEPDELAGASHFLEHLLFKGTERWSAHQIAEAIESVGGDMNAFTAHELTTYYVRVPDDRLALALEILSDIVWSPAFRSEEVDSERQVILEEIRMRDDAPEDLVHELFGEAIFPEHPIGRDVIGTPDTINAMGPGEIGGFHAEHYHPSNVVVAAAGNLDHDEVVALVEAGLAHAGGSRPARAPWQGGPAARPVAVLERDTEQAHVVLGMRAIGREDPDRYALTVLNQVLGGGMSSRLFQEVRERRGLAYSVYSYRNSFEETGTFAVAAGTAPERLDELLDTLEAELARLTVERGVTQRELAAAKGHLTGSLALSLESSNARMHRLGRSELMLGEILSLDELVAEVTRIEADDITRVVDRVLGVPERTLAVVGPVDASTFVRDRPAPRNGDAVIDPTL